MRIHNYHRAVRILGDNNVVSVSDGVLTLMIPGYFRVGLAVLFFRLGGLVYRAGRKGHYIVHASFFLPLRF